MRKRDHNVLTNAASLLICGLLAGVVVAAAAFPAVAMSGLAAKAGAETFGALPTELTVARAPQISYLLRLRRQDAARDDVRREPARTSSSRTSRRSCRRRSSRPRTTTSTSTTASTSTASPARSSTTRPGPTPAGRLDADHAVRPAGHRLLGHPPGRRGRRDRGHQRPQAARDAATPSRSTRSSPRTRSWSATSTSPPFGNGAYGIYAASQVYFGKPPSKLDIEEAAHARRHGQGADHVRPDHRGGLPGARWTGATTSSTTWSRSGRSPSRRRTRPRRSS